MNGASTRPQHAPWRPIRVALVGDQSPEVAAHSAIPLALALSAADLKTEVNPVWISTSELAQRGAAELARCDAVWCVPGSPYASMDGALEGIRYAREQRRPFLGTCGGFQHALIEYARNVLGRHEADHAESNPAAALPLISPLACSLTGVKGPVHFTPGSTIAACYGQTSAVEEYNCRFGLNPECRSLLEESSLRIGGVDEEGVVRSIELNGHPFFIATLFQPERSARTGQAHPLISAFLGATERSAPRSS